MPKSHINGSLAGSASTRESRSPDRWHKDDDLDEAIHTTIARRPWIKNCLYFLTQMTAQEVLNLQNMALILLGDHRTPEPKKHTQKSTKRRRKRKIAAGARQ
jgi:hypothetical protein